MVVPIERTGIGLEVWVRLRESGAGIVEGGVTGLNDEYLHVRIFCKAIRYNKSGSPSTNNNEIIRRVTIRRNEDKQEKAKKDGTQCRHNDQRI